ncbi:MAG: RNA polymerase sigma factor [Prolixibacteraceae bacterium]
MHESEIIQRLKKGDESAFTELVKNYQKLVINTCLGLVHNRDNAEDIAQEVFIEVFQSVDKFRSQSKISTWLYRIAVNRSLNFIRDNKKRRWFKSFEDIVRDRNTGIFNLAANPETPEDDLEKRQRTALLHEAIDTLPENQRIAFTLNKYEELSYKEISEIMELSLSSVESLIHRAKKNLQKKLYMCYKKKCI